VPLVVFTSKPAAYSSSLANIGGLLGLSSDPNTKSPLQYLTQNLKSPILTFYTKSNGKLQMFDF